MLNKVIPMLVFSASIILIEVKSYTSPSNQDIKYDRTILRYIPSGTKTSIFVSSIGKNVSSKLQQFNMFNCQISKVSASSFSDKPGVVVT